MTSHPQRFSYGASFFFLLLSVVILVGGLSVGDTSLAFTLSSFRSSGTTSVPATLPRRARIAPRVVSSSSKSSTKVGAKAPVVRFSRRGSGAVQNTTKNVSSTASSVTYDKARCGDGLVMQYSLAEKCDDGNADNGDGCSSSCAVETGFYCNGTQPSNCWSVCGDGQLAAGEKCDDGNSNDGDGCSRICKLEIGYTCTTATPNVCSPRPYCGNAVVDTGEGCDDGNSRNGDGCSTTCAVDDGFSCSGSHSSCAPVCGDGKIVNQEACDDGNTTNGDGCNSACGIENGYNCVDVPSVCRLAS